MKQMAKKSKRSEMKAKVEDKLYEPTEAVKLVKETSYTKFDGSVEAHVTTLEKDLKVKVKLPHGTGKEVKVLVLATGEAVKKAKDAGADYVGDADLIEKISKGWMEFNAVVATPDLMPKLARLGKILGPKGMMPNPKNGTITNEPAEVIKNLKGGETYLKTDLDQPTIHATIGKVSFDEKKLAENLKAVIIGVGPSRIKRVFVKATMGPSVKVNLESFN